MSHTLLQTVYQLTAKVPPEVGAPMQDPGSDLFDAVHRKLPTAASFMGRCVSIWVRLAAWEGQ